MRVVKILLIFWFIAPIAVADPHDSYREVRDRSLIIEQSGREQLIDVKSEFDGRDCSLKSNGEQGLEESLCPTSKEEGQ